MYLSKFQNVLVPMSLVTVEDWSVAELDLATREGESFKGCVCSICANCKMYLSKLNSVLVLISKCICPNGPCDIALLVKAH